MPKNKKAYKYDLSRYNFGDDGKQQSTSSTRQSDEEKRKQREIQALRDKRKQQEEDARRRVDEATKAADKKHFIDHGGKEEEYEAHKNAQEQEEARERAELERWNEESLAQEEARRAEAKARAKEQRKQADIKFYEQQEQLRKKLEKENELQKVLERPDVIRFDGQKIPIEWKITGDERQLYKLLCHLGNDMATYSKQQIYSKVRNIFDKPEFHVILCQLACAPGVLAETSNRKTPFTPHDMGHQFMRTIVHMYDSQIQAIIWIYLKLFFNLVQEYEAFATLLFVLKRECEYFFDVSEPWDMAVIMQIFRIHKLPEGMAHGQQRTRVIFALHKALMDLKHEVVLIEWTANWKNYMKVIKYDHGPLHWVQHDRAQTVRKFSDTEIEKVFQCKVCEGQQNKNLSNTHFFSENHLLTHLRQKMFGCGRHPQYKIDKTQENRKLSPDEITVWGGARILLFNCTYAANGWYWMGRLLDNGTGTISNAVDMYSGNLVLATTYTFTGGNYYLKISTSSGLFIGSNDRLTYKLIG